METIILLSFVNALISFNITETKVFEPLRKKIRKVSSYLGDLVSCGYCFSHWVAFSLVVIYQPRLFECWWLLDYFLTALVIAWLGAFQWIFMCWLMQEVGK